jgi:hypothetical protein
MRGLMVEKQNFLMQSIQTPKLFGVKKWPHWHIQILPQKYGLQIVAYSESKGFTKLAPIQKKDSIPFRNHR